MNNKKCKDAEYLVITEGGMAIRVLDKDIKKTGPNREFDPKSLIKMKKSDSIVFFSGVTKDDFLAVFYDTRKDVSYIDVVDLPIQKPGGSGRQILKISKATGNIKGAGFLNN